MASNNNKRTGNVNVCKNMETNSIMKTNEGVEGYIQPSQNKDRITIDVNEKDAHICNAELEKVLDTDEDVAESILLKKIENKINKYKVKIQLQKVVIADNQKELKAAQEEIKALRSQLQEVKDAELCLCCQ